MDEVDTVNEKNEQGAGENKPDAVCEPETNTNDEAAEPGAPNDNEESELVKRFTAFPNSQSEVDHDRLQALIDSGAHKTEATLTGGEAASHREDEQEPGNECKPEQVQDIRPAAWHHSASASNF